MVTPRTWKCNWIVVIWQLRTAVCCVALSFIMWAIKRNQRRFPPFLFFLQRVCEANNWLMACSSSVASIISHSFPPLTAQLPPPNARAIQQIHWKFIENSLEIHWEVEAAINRSSIVDPFRVNWGKIPKESSNFSIKCSIWFDFN